MINDQQHLPFVSFRIQTTVKHRVKNDCLKIPKPAELDAKGIYSHASNANKSGLSRYKIVCFKKM